MDTGFADKKFLTTHDVAQILALRESTLKFWRRTKQGPKYFRIGTRRVRYLFTDILDWINEKNKGR